MKLYLIFLTVAAATVASPGPGVLMTLSNALRYGLRGAIGGVFGIAAGIFVVAAISATSLGVVLAASAAAFTIVKFAGAAYLFYLGIRLWLAPAPEFSSGKTAYASFGRRFLEGFSLTLTNPKAIFFFLAVFPQFIEPHGNYAVQFSLLVITFSTLVIVIHTVYALFARSARDWLNSSRGGLLMNRVGGTAFMFFGVVLAAARR